MKGSYLCFILDDLNVPLESFLLVNRNNETEMSAKARATPPAIISIVSICLWLLCFGGKTVTCGVSIVLEKSLHVAVENDKHRFPDDLQK